MLYPLMGCTGCAVAGRWRGETLTEAGQRGVILDVDAGRDRQEARKRSPGCNDRALGCW